ncbi:MAG: phosphoglucosamine mutase [Clostridiales Family XIII bacterium]|jgi:phosphoglucosamine mutase|nr:phosphoglucosamine mutase [Clostridiales Family XIII bacterium]
MRKYFGTDGVRGIAGEELTAEFAFALGKAGATVLMNRTSGRMPLFIIGKDTRVSCDMLETALVSGILSVGGNVFKVGVLPTPAVAYLSRVYGADAGIVISASHNPYEYNGIKFFNKDGYKLDDEIEASIEKVLTKKSYDANVVGAVIGRITHIEEEAFDRYSKFLQESLDINISDMKIALDCSNGAAFQIAPHVYRALGAEVSVIGANPNGININDGVGSTHPETLCNFVKQVGADIGLAYDGDSDRLIAVDETGEIINGDRIMYICAQMLKEEGTLAHNTLTATVMSNLGLRLALEEADILMQTADVGDRYVLELMQQTGSVLGGEQSGHIIFLDKNTTGDGVYASLQLIRAIKKSGKKASELKNKVKIYPQVLVNAKVKTKNKHKYEEDREIWGKIIDLEKEMEGRGRVLIRPSGTEPLVRVMLEGEDEEKLGAMATELATLIEKKLNA